MRRLIIIMAFLVSVSAYSQSKSTNIVGAGNFLIQEVCDNVAPDKYITVYQVINAGTLKPFQYRDALWNIYTPISIVDSGCTSSSSAFNYDKEAVCYSDGTDTLSGWLFSFVKDSTLVNSYVTDLNLNKVNGTVIDPSFCEGCFVETKADTTFGDTVLYRYQYILALQDSARNVKLDTLIAQNYRLLAIPYDTSQVDTSLITPDICDCVGLADVEYISGTNTITIVSGTYCSFSVTVQEGELGYTQNGKTDPDGVPTGFTQGQAFGCKFMSGTIVITGLTTDTKATIQITR